MTNPCVSRFRSIHHKATIPISFPKKRKFQFFVLRNFHTSASPSISPTFPFIVATARHTPSDAPEQRSDEWFALRRDKLTTSTFGTALGLFKGKRRYELWHGKVYASEPETIEITKTHAMEWGVLNEAAAIERYKNITGRDVSSLGFATHSEERYDWIGASPDGLLGCSPGGGILEVKCPYNKGKPELGSPWKTMPFYYMPQVQGQMEIMDRDWVDLYCWTPNGSTIFRVCREREYWSLIHGILREFWWENVVPARRALVLGMKDDVKLFEPSSTHRQTGLVIHKSIKLAGEAKLLCREIAGNVEFFEHAKCLGKKKKGMDVFSSEGVSWADQWDPEPLPPVSSEKDKKKGKDGKGKFAKKIFSLQWMKNRGSKNKPQK